MQFLRIFAGGLPKDVAKEELHARFSKFGKVSDVEIKIKTDATGEWMKTFAYMNMETSQQNFNKCKSQLNNTIWRDGKITVQLAKQSTADKYACERNQPNTKVVKELTIPTVQKGAVPGTAVPDHENWVVTKFQRVVPVMNVRSKDKKKVIRYDPSKHSHQIKRLDNPKDDVEISECVGGLTWSFGDSNAAENESNSSYRKRVGDFSEVKSSPSKKVKAGRSAADILAEERAKRKRYVDDLEVVTSESTEQRLAASRNEVPNHNVDLSKFDSDSDNELQSATKMSSTKSETPANRKRTKKVVNRRAVNATRASVSQSSDSSSDSEIEMPAKRSTTKVEANNIHTTTCGSIPHNASHNKRVQSTKSTHSNTSGTGFRKHVNESSDSTSDRDSSSSSHSSCEKTDKGTGTNNTKRTKIQQKAIPGTTPLSNNSVAPGKTSGVVDDKVIVASNTPSVEGHKSDSVKSPDSSAISVSGSTPAGLQMALLLESAASILRSAASSGNAMDMLAGNTQLASLFGSLPGKASSDSTPHAQNKNDETLSRAVNFSETSSSSDSSTDDKPTNTKKQKSTSSSTNTDVEPEMVEKNSHTKPKVASPTSSDSSSSDEDGKLSTQGKVQAASAHRIKASDSSSSSDVDNSSDSDSESNVTSAPQMSTKMDTGVQSSNSSDSYSTSSSSDEEPIKNKQKGQASNSGMKKEPKKPKVKDGTKKKPIVSVAEKRDLANQRRLEALAAKKNEMRAQKQAVAVSLSSMDAPATSKKIVFDDSDEDDEKATDATVSNSQVKVEIKKPAGVSGKILFESSDEEEKGDDYDKMFDVKAHFEGEKGAKLLHLQKSFNDDSRFKLTDKFMESESDSSTAEEEEAEVAPADQPELDGEQERRKNLQILQSIVGSKGVSLDHPTSSQSKAKKLADTPATVFRDISSMHFDPTSESHDQLVKKIVPSERPKKSRKKKLEGSEPVVGNQPAPEVSKERFFEVDVDFATSKSAQNGSSGTGMIFNFLANDDEPVDKKSDEETSESGDSESAEMAEVPQKYKSPFADMSTEARFNDVNEVENEESNKPASPAHQIPTNEDTASVNTVVDWFMFKPDDIRLADGAKRFCKTLDETVLRQKWDELRPKLVDNYLLKSKRAVKKVNSHSSSAIKKRFSAKRGGKAVKRKAGKPK